jgi:BirA family biotin operon repressor/biotin-[acetyl-CoA-carboxylase] ligase
LKMEERNLRSTLSKLPLGGLRYFEQITSTNDIALAWAAEGAPDLALVYAGEQTAGRGRGGGRWFTPPGSALAFSLILYPTPGEQQNLACFSALGALAVCDALERHGLQPEIKWPNDVLLNRRKVCGILVESTWLGEKMESMVLGLGLNIKPAAVPPPEQLNFPATCLEAELPRSGCRVQRAALLRQILKSLLDWRDRMAGDIFMQAWDRRLAFRGEMVEILVDGPASRMGQLDGLERNGSLRLISPQGRTFTVPMGEVHLRPAGN